MTLKDLPIGKSATVVTVGGEGALRQHFLDMGLIPGVVAEAYEGMDAIITQGFVGVTSEGRPTVLGRGGSDYSASLIGMAVDAEKIEIWTDVDGVRTADPRYVPNTKSLEQIISACTCS